jgi:hypothetical protein
MPEKLLNTIYAGPTPVYEIVESEDGLTITLRSADSPDNQLRMIRTAVGTLADALRRIEPTAKR